MDDSLIIAGPPLVGRTGVAVSQSVRSSVLVRLFAATLFMSAFLMFLVEPMIARILLPSLGGAPAVWNTCLVFFQAMLLVGYGYAHGATQYLGIRRHVVLHSVLLLLPLIVLPIAVRYSPPQGLESPALWLLLTLLGSIGLPFFVLSTTAAVMQKWFSATNDGAAADPYFLYAASNLGSFIALMAYPLVVEPNLRLQDQATLVDSGLRRPHRALVRVCRRGVAEPRGDEPNDQHGACAGGGAVVGPSRPLDRVGSGAVEPAAGGHELHLDRRGLGAFVVGPAPWPLSAHARHRL